MDRMLEETYRAEQRHFWFRGFRRFVTPLLREASTGIERPRILDCGCGTGANLSLLGGFGRPFGIDRSRRGLEFARQRGATRIAQASVHALPVASETVDITVSFDVLYCLPDDVERAAIREMHRVLKPGGAAIVNAAALDMLKGDHSVLVEEIRRYTRRSLSDRLRAGGFRVERITYTNAALFPVAAAVRALQRLRGVKGDRGGDFYVPPAPINALFSGLLSAEAAMIAAGVNMPIGSSVLCLARKI